ncbi:MAG TPA: hypothetical protein VNY75_09335 [Rhizomicrobium sp.]|nr:hypothetical protein [Rhizomicrobium sp.]
MKQSFRLLLACAAVFTAAQCIVAVAQPVTRVKAKLTAFDGEVMSLEPLPPSSRDRAGAAKPAEPFTVSVLPETRYVSSDKALFAAIKPGDYVGAAVTEGRGGTLRAQEVYLYAEALRGTGEGRFPEGGRLIINGTVSAVQPTTAEDKQDGTLTLHYRGALLTGLGRGRTLCEGRASPPAYASPLACAADAVIEVLPGTPVSALTVGDKSLLVPGSVVTVAMTKTEDGKNLAPGMVVEKLTPVEKPQSSP